MQVSSILLISLSFTYYETSGIHSGCWGTVDEAEGDEHDEIAGPVEDQSSSSEEQDTQIKSLLPPDPDKQTPSY